MIVKKISFRTRNEEGKWLPKGVGIGSQPRFGSKKADFQVRIAADARKYGRRSEIYREFPLLHPIFPVIGRGTEKNVRVNGAEPASPSRPVWAARSWMP
jgi:hypothetical protein